MTTVMIRKLAPVSLLGAVALGLAGCASNAEQERASVAYQASTDRMDALAARGHAAGGAATVKAPRVGTQLSWSCTGPYAANYDITVDGIDRGLVQYSGKITYAGSGSTAYPYETEKHWTLTGTGLWSSKIGDQRQWFDYEYFQDFARLEPGRVFRGPVSARSDESLWVWDYEISVGERMPIVHDLLGRINVVPISEKRKIFHSGYTATLVTLLEPERGISVSWTFTDEQGSEQCELVRLGNARSAAG